MERLVRAIRSGIDAALALPGGFASWARTMDDQTFTAIMIAGAALLGIAVWRALRL